MSETTTKMNDDDYYCYAVDIEDGEDYMPEINTKAKEESGSLSKLDKEKFEKQKQYMIQFAGVLGGMILLYAGYKGYRMIKQRLSE